MIMEQAASFIVMSICAVPAIFFGIVLCCGKGADMIAGYNALSPAERTAWNEKALCRATGVLLLVMVGCLELLLLGAVFGMTALEWGGGILLAVSTVSGLIYINKSKRFKRK